MKTFTLRLQDATRHQTFDAVTSFVGENASGSFGILAGHTRCITTLVVGLARFRVGEQTWQYLAVPGAVLYFHNNVLTLSSRRYLLNDDYRQISRELKELLLAEEEQLHSMKKSLHRIESEVLKRLWELGKQDTG